MQEVGIVVRVTLEPGRLRARVKDLDEHVWRWQVRVRRGGDGRDLIKARTPRAELVVPEVDDAEGPFAGYELTVSCAKVWLQQR